MFQQFILGLEVVNECSSDLRLLEGTVHVALVEDVVLVLFLVVIVVAKLVVAVDFVFGSGQ